MRPVIAVAALLLSFSAAHAAVGDEFFCNVANVQIVDIDGHQDSGFIASNRQKTYGITIRPNSILTVFTNEGQTFSRDYVIATDTVHDLIGSKIDNNFADTIAISKMPNPRFANMYTAAITVQGSTFVNVWLLLCTKSN